MKYIAREEGYSPLALCTSLHPEKFLHDVRSEEHTSLSNDSQKHTLLHCHKAGFLSRLFIDIGRLVSDPTEIFNHKLGGDSRPISINKCE